MEDFINARERFRTAKPTSTATHKFAVGAQVVHMVGSRSERVFFKVTRQLPDGGQGLQYRIRSDRDGHERVASESTLERPTQDDSTP
jgi:hypothetical protein